MSDYGYPSAPAGNPTGQTPMHQPPPVYPKLDVGDVLQTSAGLVAKNFASFLAVAVLFATPGIILSGILAKIVMGSMVALQQAAMNGDFGGLIDAFPMTSVILSIAGGFVNAVLVYTGMGTLMYAAVESLAGRQHSVGEVLSHGLRSAPSVAIVAVVIMVAQTVAMLPGLMAITLGSIGATSGGFEALLCCLLPTGLLMLLVPFVYVVILLFLAIPSAVLEGIGPITALSRSVQLTKGHRGTIFLIMFIVGLVMLILSVILSMLGGAGMNQIDPTTMQFQEPTMFAFLMSLITQYIMAIFRIIVIGSLASVIYARIRGLKDGVDANAIAQVFS